MQLQIERFKGRIAEVKIGRRPVTVGGDRGLPFYRFEWKAANRPLIALEIPEDSSSWPESLIKKAGSAAGAGPGTWARFCADRGADLICIRIAEREYAEGQVPGSGEAVRAVEEVLGAVDVPAMVAGTGRPDIDNVIMPAIADEFKGETLALGSATQDNYNVLTRACLDFGHVIIAESPIDINICKQLDILITDAGLPLDRILIDPTTGGLGYGIEYTYSIMEKARLAALSGDRMLACPVVCFVGKETWKVKEASVAGPETTAWGDVSRRGVLWEAVGAAALLAAGAHILVMRDMEAAGETRAHIDALWQEQHAQEHRQGE